MNLTDSMFVPHSTVVLIGYADDGPVDELMYVENNIITDELFGKNSQLANAVHDAYNAGAQSVLALRVNGVCATVDVQGYFKLTQTYAGSKYNGTNVTISNGFLTIGDVEYELHSFDDTRSLVNIINYDFSISKHTYQAGLLQNVPIATLTDCVLQLDGGFDQPEIPPTIMQDRLDSIYFNLRTYPVNIVVPVCADFDNDSNVDYGRQLIDYCKSRFELGEDVIGILPTKIQLFFEMQGLPENIIRDRKALILDNLGEVYDMNNNLISSYGIDGRFLSVAISECWFTNGLSRMANGAAVYAGMVSSNPFTSTTNKPLPNVSDIELEYTQDQLETELNRYVVFHKTIRNGICVYRGNTMYQPFSLSTSKIINHINYVLAEGIPDVNALIPYGISKQKVIKDVSDLIQPLVDSKEIRTFKVNVDGIDYDSQYITLTVDFIRYGEVKHISTQAGIYYGV